MLNSEIIEMILENRGIKDIEGFLNPRLEDNLLPLDELKNIDKAIDVILSSVKRGDLIGIYADV